MRILAWFQNNNLIFFCQIDIKTFVIIQSTYLTKMTFVELEKLSF